MMQLLAQAAATTPNAGDGDGVFLIWGFILLAAALGLLALELFVPSGGLLGVLCGISVIGSIVCFFRYDTTIGAIALGLYLILGPAFGVFLFKWWLHSPLAKRMILGGNESLIADDEDARREADRARQAHQAELRQLIGAEGTAVTSLRPVGIVRIAGRRVDALAESGIIEANTPIVVVEILDNQIKVRPHANPGATTPT